MSKKNLTITAEEEVVRWAKIQAAKQDTSVSRLVGELLAERMAEERDYETAIRSFLAREPTKISSGAYPSREEVHERSRVP